MNKKIILLILLALPFAATAQYKYKGKSLGKGHKVTVKWLGNLNKTYQASFQGMDIWDNYLISLQNHGMASVYHFEGKKPVFKGQFPLASYNNSKTDFNHANSASFSTQFAQQGDKLPLVYIARCNGNLWKNMRNICYVERINPDKMTSELVQTISYNSASTAYRTTLWAVDNEKHLLYAFGSIAEKPFTRHFIAKFNIPSYNGPQDSVVVLEEKDALEKYIIEDTYKDENFHPVTQGGCIRNDIFYLPMGVGDEKRPSILYVWDLKKHKMRNVIDLQEAIPVEFEDCTFYGNDLIIHTQKNLFKVIFQ